MSIIRLYHPENILENSTSLLSKEHTHYLVNVMRAKRGRNVNFFNKNGEWLSEIVFLEKDRVEVKFLSKVKENTNTLNIELAICLVKKSAMEIILQKATELGIKKIIPIISERTEVKEINFERATKIVIEATEQSNQLEPPEISEILKLKDFLNINTNKKNIFCRY
jgi:16S rRNA (uracil1498-N3)-methyltransferase